MVRAGDGREEQPCGQVGGDGAKGRTEAWRSTRDSALHNTCSTLLEGAVWFLLRLWGMHMVCRFI
jgi:hypothetical protein